MSAQTVTEVHLLGGPHDGLVIDRRQIHAPGVAWPTVLRIGHVAGSMIGEDGRVVPPSKLSYTVCEYVRCGESRYRFVGVKR